MLDLAAQHIQGPGALLLFDVGATEQIHGHENGSQGVAQLMSERGEELVFAFALIHQLLGALLQFFFEVFAAIDLIAQRFVAVSQFAGALSDLILELQPHALQGGFGGLALSDVVSDPLEKQRGAVLIADDLAFAMHPDHPAVAGDEAVFGFEMGACGAGLGEIFLPALAIVGVKLVVPEEGIIQPFVLREAEKVFDLRADVELVSVEIQASEKGDNRDLLDQSAIALLGAAELFLNGIAGNMCGGWRSFSGGSLKPGCQRHLLEQCFGLQKFRGGINVAI